MNADTLTIAAGDASASLSLKGAEPMTWRIAGRDYLWHGDPRHWDRRAPILFPVVGASSGGAVRVGGRDYPMARHGFARNALFSVTEAVADVVRLRLAADDATRAHYPFDFTLDVTAKLAPRSLSLSFDIGNAGSVAMPYSLGFHPAFPWPFAGGDTQGYQLVFEQEENRDVPEITKDGLIANRKRPLAFDGRALPLSPALFEHDALCFFNARSKTMRFRAPGGETIAMTMEDFPHLALWTKPGSPFLSMECWTGHADREGFSGDLSQRASSRSLAPGAHATYAVTMTIENN